MFDLKQAMFTILLISGMLHISGSDRKLKRAKSRSYPPPKYVNYQNERLPNDMQVSVFLYKEENKEYYYFSPMTMSNASLSITVTSCISPIHWTIRFRQNNTNTDVLIDDLITKDMQTVHLKALHGLYVISLASTESDSYAHIYVSTEPGGPQALMNSKHHKLKLLKKQRSKRLSVRWDPSLVDPQGTDYCLVTNTKRHYTSLCSAQGYSYDQLSPRLKMQPKAASQTVISTDDSKFGLQELHPVIVCVGPQTHYTLSELRQGQSYYFDLFAINRQSNLTYPHGNSFIIFDNRIKPTSLKDGKSTFVNLKKQDGRVVFRYKVGRRSGNVLELYFMPCGGSIDVVVTLKGEIVVTKTRIEGFGRLFVSKLIKGQRYYVRILSTNTEELRKTSGVEIYATTKPSSKSPLPSIPNEPMVQEYVSLRQCNSVTVGWLPSPGQKSAYYCLVVREGKIGDADGFRLPNQCGLENRLKKSADFDFKYCQDRQNKEKVLMQRIGQLRPGRHYVIQVTVKKPKGKTLSYDLLQVQTKPSCEILS